MWQGGVRGLSVLGKRGVCMAKGGGAWPGGHAWQGGMHGERGEV